MYGRSLKNFFRSAVRLKHLEYLAILEKTQWLKREEIAKMQWQRLRALIKHAYFTVPYYHRVFKQRGLMPEDIKNPDSLLKLPILTKEDIRGNFNDLISRGFPRKEIIASSTGGSTGEPLRFYTTRESINWSTAAELRAYKWSGFRLGDRQALIWGSPIDLAKWSSLRGRVWNFVTGTLVLNAGSMSETSMKRFAEKLMRFRPKLIRGYASGVYLFAKFLESKGINLKPGAVITTAETLFSHQRAKIEDVFGCSVYDFYGSREVPALACGCSEKSGYHISSENVLLEFIKDNEKVAANETGAILVTDLTNYAMPFIRYRIGDLGKPLDEACPCGRGLSLFGSLEGRITDVIVTRDGKYVSSPVFTLVFKDLEHVKEYQIIQESYEKIKVKIVKRGQYSEQDSNYIISGMKKIIGEDVQIEIEFVDSIPPTRSGKRRVVISRISKN
jgi:phenylacetate-CoA ligase